MQDLVAQFESLWIGLCIRIAVAIENTDFRIEVPAVVIERTTPGKGTVHCLDVFECHVFDVHEADNDIGNLNARVVNVVLYFDSIAGGLQNANEGITEHGISYVSDMRGFIWIDARVLNHLLWSLIFRRAV